MNTLSFVVFSIAVSVFFGAIVLIAQKNYQDGSWFAKCGKEFKLGCKPPATFGFMFWFGYNKQKRRSNLATYR